MLAPPGARPLVFATRNRGKLVELRQLLPGVDVLSIDEATARTGNTIPEVDDDADTFVGNATKTARAVSLATGLPALADDSGLEVDALGGAPGVYSARYAGEGAGDAANNAKLLTPPRGRIEVHGGQPTVALAGETGLACLAEVQPHAVLLDIGLPGLDGDETCRRIRAALGAQVTILAVTGWGQSQDRQRAVDAGFDAHVTKPPELAQLRSFLRP